MFEAQKTYISIIQNGTSLPLGTVKKEIAIKRPLNLKSENLSIETEAILTPLTPEKMKILREQKMAFGMAKYMAEEINNLQMQWLAKVQFMGRRDRRCFSKHLAKMMQDFKVLCKRNGIQYTITKDNEER